VKELRAKYDESIERLGLMLDYPWDSPEFYAAWLTQSYYYSRRVTRILLLASANSTMEQQKVHRRMMTHASEEKGHELLAERDVKDLGYDVQSIGEFSVTRGFYATQYFTIEHVSPESLFGWILPLEGLAIHYGKEIWNRVKSNTSAPTRFLDVHVNEDPDHVGSAFSTVNGMSAEHHAQICANMDFTVNTYFSILKNCREFAQQGQARIATSNVVPLRKAA